MTRVRLIATALLVVLACLMGVNAISHRLPPTAALWFGFAWGILFAVNIRTLAQSDQ